MSKFIPWIDDDNLNATQDYTTFVGDSQRQEGFRGGTPASAIRVNTALRQSSLVISALMNVLANDDTTTDFRTDLDTFTTFLDTKLTQKIKTTKVDNTAQADNATNAVNATNATNVVSTSTIKLPLTINDNNQLIVNDEIIVRKKLVWSGNLTANTEEGSAIALPFEINSNDLYEVEMNVPFEGYSNGCKCYVKFPNMLKVAEGTVGGSLFTQIDDSTPGVWLFSAKVKIQDHVDKEIRLYPCHATLANATTLNVVNSQFANTILATSITKIYKIIE